MAGDKRDIMLWDTIGWTVEADLEVENPYDVEAWAIFEHENGHEIRRTPFYYDKENRWAFRFCGSRAGEWSMYTESQYPGLDGIEGRVKVRDDPERMGFLVAAGNKFARMNGSCDDLQAQVYQVYMNKRSEDAEINPGFGGKDIPDADGGRKESIVKTWGGTENKERRINYINQAVENGCNAIFLHVNNQWLCDGVKRWDGHESENPDVAVFEAIEDLISEVRAHGLQLHIWAWGDESGTRRRWTPVGLKGGINGEVDRRIQRYIAARLGPLPGWTLSYGFDLHEEDWVGADTAEGAAKLDEWARYMEEYLGWPHLLGARVHEFSDRVRERKLDCVYNSYACGGREPREEGYARLETVKHGPHKYTEVCGDMRDDRPTMYEERHAYRREDGLADHESQWHMTMDGTLRLRWWQAMAGGAGGWIGFYSEENRVNAPGPYPNPESLRTYISFWRDRLALDMEPRNELTGGPERCQYALYSVETNRAVIYAEETNRVQLNLSVIPGKVWIGIVDTQKSYEEIELGVFRGEDRVLDLSEYGSPTDWAVTLDWSCE